MTTGDARDNEALVAFLQALAVTIVGIDDLPSRKMSGSEFLTVLDEYIGEIPNMTEREGSAYIHGRVQLLRNNLEIALRQARNAKWGFGRRN